MRKILIGIMIIGFLFGLSILLYPLFSNVWNEYRENRLFNAYVEKTAQEEEYDFEAQWEAAWNYNQGLEPILLPDSFLGAEEPYTKDETYAACLNTDGDGLMGYISIPRIGIRVKMYHSTEKEVLEKGAGHLQGSSLPAGGINTHSVLSAHRGIPDDSLFTDLDQIKEGDQFYLYVLNDVLAYEVDQISVIEPTETDELRIIEGEDLVTLLTCTPYGVNSHRLLVRGHRVPYDKEKEAEQAKDMVRGLNTNYVIWAIGGVISAGVVILPIYLFTRRKRKKGE